MDFHISRAAFLVLVVSAIVLQSCSSDSGCGKNERSYNGRCVCADGFVSDGGQCVAYEAEETDDWEDELADEFVSDGDLTEPAEEIEKAPRLLPAKTYNSTIHTIGAANETVIYYVYVPERMSDEKLPVIIGVCGMDAKYYMQKPFSTFADTNHFVIIAPAYVSDDASFLEEKSYEYPAAWSGESTLKIVATVADKYSLATDKLYLFGFSAGAQFAHRFAMLYPELTVVAAVNSPFYYTMPTQFISTRFLVTVGSLDTERLPQAEEFVASAQSFGIKIVYKIIYDVGHNLTGLQEEMAFRYYLDANSLNR